MQFRARPTAALKARPVVVAKAHFGVFAAAVRTPLDRSSLARASPDPVRSRKHPKKPSALGRASPKSPKKNRPKARSQVHETKTDRRFFFSLPKKTQDADTLEKVRTIISEQLGTDLDAVAADAKFVDLGADSLDTVEIMMALEEQFEITLDEEGAEKIATVQEAADMIQDQMA